jgi:hypothetical protein
VKNSLEGSKANSSRQKNQQTLRQLKEFSLRKKVERGMEKCEQSLWDLWELVSGSCIHYRSSRRRKDIEKERELL